jgi:protein KRI1
MARRKRNQPGTDSNPKIPINANAESNKTYARSQNPSERISNDTELKRSFDATQDFTDLGDKVISKKAKLGNGGISDVIERETIADRKTILLDGSEGDESDVSMKDEDAVLKVNESYARRFEYNKKRVELEQLETKYGNTDVSLSKREDSDSVSSSEDESEDEDGEFATETLDTEIAATLKAIREKDPRIFDQTAKFYTEFDFGATASGKAEKEEKPMFLHDYHRKNLLDGANETGEQEEQPPLRSYIQEQEELKRDLVKSMHDAADENVSNESDAEDDFLKPTKLPTPETNQPPVPDVETADKDPETFLSNYLTARAWIPTSTSRFAHLESDDDEEDQRADEFEQAYNMRFEDPNTSNQKLMSYSRDVVNEKSVRRGEKNARQKAREREKQKKEDEKKERVEERKRLKKLKMEEMEEKIAKIREAAGIRRKDVRIEEWVGLLEADFDDNQWDEELRKQFGDQHFEEEDGVDQVDREVKKVPKKPKWKDDIGISDLIPDFDDKEGPDFDLLNSSEDDQDEETIAKAGEKTIKAARSEAKASSRRDRRILEALADQQLDFPTTSKKGNAFTPFSYREVSPTSFGLTPLDILAADDAQLNQFVGLKKLAPFRDEKRKRKDKKRLGKKGRLRMWRKEVFGRDEGPDREKIFANAEAHGESEDTVGVNIREGKKKRRKRSKKKGKNVLV